MFISQFSLLVQRLVDRPEFLDFFLREEVLQLALPDLLVEDQEVEQFELLCPVEAVAAHLEAPQGDVRELLRVAVLFDVDEFAEEEGEFEEEVGVEEVVHLAVEELQVDLFGHCGTVELVDEDVGEDAEEVHQRAPLRPHPASALDHEVGDVLVHHPVLLDDLFVEEPEGGADQLLVEAVQQVAH